jgi:hypothetical protein
VQNNQHTTRVPQSQAKDGIAKDGIAKDGIGISSEGKKH